MRVVREQMLCVISPDWPDDTEVLTSDGLASIVNSHPALN